MTKPIPTAYTRFQNVESSKTTNIINTSELNLIGPILNSGGRLGKSNYATELLSSNNPDLISHRVQELIKLNEKRKLIQC